MRQPVVYLSGPITGTDDYKERFKDLQTKLSGLGYEVINPVELTAYLSEGSTWVTYMEVCLPVIAVCDYVYLMDGWEKSDGARIERTVALMLDKTLVVHLGDRGEEDGSL